MVSDEIFSPLRGVTTVFTVAPSVPLVTDRSSRHSASAFSGPNWIKTGPPHTRSGLESIQPVVVGGGSLTRRGGMRSTSPDQCGMGTPAMVADAVDGATVEDVAVAPRR